MTAPTPKLMTLAELEPDELTGFVGGTTVVMMPLDKVHRMAATIRAQHEALKAASSYSNHDVGCLAIFNADQPPPNKQYPCKCGYERESAAWRPIIAAVEGKP